MVERDILFQQQPFSPITKALFIALAILCLLPTLTFPISHDHAIFYLGGKAILEGKLLYRDFVDIKPPLIYNVFAFIQTVFGNSEVALRFFDVVWQVCTLLSLRFVVQQWMQSERIAYGSIVVYALSFAISNYSSTLQCETLAVLPILWLLYLYQQYRHTGAVWLAMGALYACLVYLKYTLGIVFLPIVLFDLFRYKLSIGALFGRYGLFLVGFALVSVVIFLPFLQTPNGIQQYLNLLAYTGNYAAQTSNATALVSAKSLLMYYADKFSLVFSLAAVASVLLLYRNKEALTSTQRDTFFFLVLQYAVLLLSVIVERKFIPYHFSRMYGVVAPFVALGLYMLYSRLRSLWNAQKTAAYRTAIVVGIAIALVATPLPRFARIAYGAYLYFVSPQAYTALYTKSDPQESVIILADQLEVVNFVRTHAQPSEHIAVASVIAPCVYYYLQPSVAPPLPSSQFALAPRTPQPWRELFAEQLRNSDWLIVQTNDIHPLLMMGSTQTTPELLTRDTLYASILTARYREVRRFRKFIVYHTSAK